MIQVNDMRVGITGGIGSGKSYVANIINQNGYSVFNCDKEAKKLMLSDKYIINKICDCIGYDAYIKPDEIISHNNNQNIQINKYCDYSGWKLNKKVISDFLYKNKQNATLLNNIVHPRLAEFFQDWAKRHKNEMVFLESAILFESGFDNYVDRVVYVYAEEEVRINRTMHRDHTTRNKVMEIMKQQWNQESIMLQAHYIIYNNGHENVEEQITQLIKKLNNDSFYLMN